MINPPKPPKTIQLVYDCHGELTYQKNDGRLNLYLIDKDWPNKAPHTEHFYTLEESEQVTYAGSHKEQNLIDKVRMRAMEPKKEMTATDAWIAMAKGECVKTHHYIHVIRDNCFKFWNGQGWCAACELDSGPYSIVPDPSKPEVKVNEYEADKLRIIDASFHNTTTDRVKVMIKFVEKHFQRKEAKS
jgi:hypothetical protein